MSKVSKLTILLLLCAQAGFGALAFSVNSFTPAPDTNSASYIGFEFTVTTPQTVTELGVLNTNAVTSLPGNTGVGIYAVSAGTVSKPAVAVITAVVPAGTAPTVAGALGAFMVSVTPTVLDPGNYVLMTETGPPHAGFGSASLAFPAGMSYVNGWFGGTAFPGIGTNFTLTNQSDGGNNWVSAIYSIAPQPTGVTLNFSAASPGSVPDASGQGTGFQARLPLTGDNYANSDPNLTLNAAARSLTLRSTASDVNGSSNLAAAEFIGVPLLPYGVGGTEDFLVQATFASVQFSQTYDQTGLFVGTDGQTLFRGGILFNGSSQYFTVQTLADGVGFDSGLQTVAGGVAGDTLVFSIARISGTWYFRVENKTRPNLSATVPISQPTSLNGSSALIGGIFASNTGNVTPKSQTITSFYAGQLLPSSVAYFGVDSATHGAWRTSGVTKIRDGDRNNIYGSDGYVLTGNTSRSQSPSYATVAQIGPLTLDGNGNYLLLDNPLSAGTVVSGLWYQTAISAAEHDLAQISFTGFVQTRIGVLISNADVASVSPDSLRIRQTAGGTADSGPISAPLNNARTGDWYFFDVSAKPGDTFILSGVNALPDNTNGIGAITFDTIAPLAGTPLLVSTTGLASGQAATAYVAQLVASGGTPPYSWTATGLPPGLTLSQAGLIQGAPGQAGTYSVTVRVTDSFSGSASATLSLAVNPNVIPLFVTGYGNLGATALGKPAGSGSFSASGGKAPYSWNLSGAPDGIGLTASGASATIGGTPRQAGVFSFSVTVSDAQGERASAAGSVSVLGLGSTSLPAGTAFSPYSASIAAVGGAPPYTFKVTGMPGGLSISADGLLRGTPQHDGLFTLAIDLSDSAGNLVSGSATLTIQPPPALRISGNLQSGAILTAYSAALTATGGGAPYVFSIAGGSLPGGIRMSNAGAFTGTPTTPGAFTFTARVTDTAGTSATGAFSITIVPPPLTISAPSPLPSGMVSIDYPAQTITASGGVGPYTFTVTGGNAPGGIALSDTGVLSGTPTASGAFNFTVQAADTTGVTASTALGLEVRPFSGDLSLSDGAVSFSLAAGTTSLPGAVNIRVQSTDVGQTPGWKATANTPWFSLTGAEGVTPGSFGIQLNAAAANLGPAGSAYSGNVTVTCTTAPCSGKTQNVAVNLTVANRPALLSVSAGSLAFQGTIINPVALTQSISISNTGGGTLGIGAIGCGASWCHVGGQPATLAAGASATLDVTVDSLEAGYFWSEISLSTSGGKATVPVTYFVAGKPAVTLAPSGLTTSAPVGGGVAGPAAGFFVTLQNGTSASWTASIQQGDFLRLGTASGTATPNQPGRVDFSFNNAAVAALKEGTYYGTIRVVASGVANSPLDYTVVLAVTPASETPKPFPSPAGLVFFSNAASRVSSQPITLYSSSPHATAYQTSTATDDGGTWLSVSPKTGSTSVDAAAETRVSADGTNLKPGVYRGLVNYAFASAGIRSVNVTLIVAAPAAPGGLQPHAEGCAATQVIPTQTGLVTNFSAPAAWPVAVEVALYNDCGETVPNGKVVTTFSNGDPPLALTLTDPKSGRYVATWTPRKATTQATITALATAAGFPSATIKFGGSVIPNKAPILNKDAVLNIYNPVGGVPAAPGTLVSIKGEYLTGVPLTNTKIPFPTVLGGTSVIIGGLKAPVAAVTPTQVDVQVPAELTPGQPYQVIVSANGALTTPDGLQMAETSPGLSLLPTGFVNATHQTGGVVTEASPARPGEGILIYLAGMGLTEKPVPSGEAAADPLRVANPPQITLNGLAVPFDFAGLIPGLVGVYQINMTVPEGAQNGNLTLALTQAGIPSNSGLLPVKK